MEKVQLQDDDVVIELPDTPCTADVYDRMIIDARFLNVLDFKVYSLQELIAATDDFHSSKLLGEGSNGQVFGGVLEDGSQIAVKRLPESARRVIEEEEDFVNEIRRIGSVNHRNIMELLGFCLEGQSPLLVSRKLYSLYTALYEDRALDWDATYNIAIDVAKGLSYLHDGTRRQMVHCDIKPGNILLDPHTRQAYISDFGLVHLGRGHQSKEGLEEIEVKWYYGSHGYRAPEVRGRKRLSAKSDVYSYGKLLYALVSAQKDVQRMPSLLIGKNVGTTKGFRKLMFKMKIWSMRLFPWVRVLLRRSVLSVLDKRLSEDVHNPGRKIVQMAAMIRLIIVCTQEDSAMRPSMEGVVIELERANMRNISWSIKAAVKLGFGWYRLLLSLFSLSVLIVACFLAFYIVAWFGAFYIAASTPGESLGSIIGGFIFQSLLLWRALRYACVVDELLYGNSEEDTKFGWRKLGTR